MMKRSILSILAFTVIFLTACNSNVQEKEKQDSIEAAAAADSMLREATQEADTSLTVDSVIIDTTKAD